MPLEIRELIIKANLGDENENSGRISPENNQQTGDKSVVQACVERVLEILKQREER